MPELKATKLVLIVCLGDYGIRVIFEPGRTVEAYKEGKLIFTSSIASSLLMLDLKSLSSTNAYIVTPAQELVSTTFKESKFDLWHRRLGYISKNTMQELAKVVDGLDLGRKPDRPAGETAYLPCLAGKIHESFSKATDTRATKPLERIHANISGIKTKTKRGYKYFLLLVDDYTRYYWIFLLRTKETTEVVLIFRQFRAIVETENYATGHCIIYFRSDNRKGEFGISL